MKRRGVGPAENEVKIFLQLDKEIGLIINGLLPKSSMQGEDGFSEMTSPGALVLKRKYLQPVEATLTAHLDNSPFSL